jgi:hypothetical protein
MSIALRAYLLPLFFAPLLACSGADPGTSGGRDGNGANDGSAGDAGPGDGGLHPDGGGTADAGPDAGHGADGGADAGPDAGTIPDAGPGPDAGTLPDAGLSDAGSQADAGPPVDAGSPPTVNITLSGACPALTACGGGLVGEWWYSAGCMEDPFPGIKQYCSSATYSGQSVTVTGKVVYTASTVTRTGTAIAKGNIHVPSSCAWVGCSTIENGILNNGCSSATCSSGSSGSCDCVVNCVGPINESFPYTVSGGVIHVAASPARNHDYCVNGPTLEYHQTDTQPAESGWYTLSRH